MIRTFALLLSEGSISTNMKIVSSAARGSCFVGVVRKNRKWRIYRENQHSTSLNPHPGGSFTLCHYVQYTFFSSLTAFGAVKHLLYIYSHLWRNRRLWWRVKNLMVFFILKLSPENWRRPRETSHGIEMRQKKTNWEKKSRGKFMSAIYQLWIWRSRYGDLEVFVFPLSRLVLWRGQFRSSGGASPIFKQKLDGLEEQQTLHSEISARPEIIKQQQHGFAISGN